MRNSDWSSDVCSSDLGEAMHALGVPTTRSLAVVATGEKIARETMLPGAVLCRVAASHLRVGTFQYPSEQPAPTLLRRLADHAIPPPHPQAPPAADPHPALLQAFPESPVPTYARRSHCIYHQSVPEHTNHTTTHET